MLKAIHAQESKTAARAKANDVVAALKEMKLKEAAKKVEDGVEKTLTYADFPSEHWTAEQRNSQAHPRDCRNTFQRKIPG